MFLELLLGTIKNIFEKHICVCVGRNLVSADLLNLLFFLKKLILGKKCSKASSCSDVCRHPIREKGIGQDFPLNLMM